ncbi:energy transducer TonB [Pseudoalteromonas atlantica]|uniref:energy transducer TonB n=1 Tax=Pseudoalteromonas atlantica TaxID=288 RepID=UPI0037353548
MKTLSLIFFSILVLGCTSTPEVVLNQEPVEVTNDNVRQYWVLKNKSFSFNLPLKRAPKKLEEGHVTLRFLIDSNGNTFDPEIIESVPAGIWDYAGVKAMSKQDFIPAKSNTLGVPVYFTQTIFFK